MILRRAVLLGCMAGMGMAAGAQVATPAVPPVPPPAPALVDTAKQMAAMQAKLDDWPQLARYRDADATLPPPAPGEKRVVFYGDSITDAWAKKPDAFFPGKPYVDRGISGQTTAQMLLRFRQDVINLHPKAVVILGGTNDIAGNTGPMTPEMTEGNWQSMAELAKANGIAVIFASLTPSTEFPWRRGLQPAGKIRALNAWLKQYCATRGLTYLDVLSALTDAEGGMKEGLSLDGVHPNARGYALMEPPTQAAIEKALGSNQ